MTEQEIIDAITLLSKQQGFYGRVLQIINEDKDFLNFLVNQKFKSIIDLVLYLEQ